MESNLKLFLAQETKVIINSTHTILSSEGLQKVAIFSSKNERATKKPNAIITLFNKSFSYYTRNFWFTFSLLSLPLRSEQVGILQSCHSQIFIGALICHIVITLRLLFMVRILIWNKPGLL